MKMVIRTRGHCIAAGRKPGDFFEELGTGELRSPEFGTVHLANIAQEHGKWQASIL